MKKTECHAQPLSWRILLADALFNVFQLEPYNLIADSAAASIHVYRDACLGCSRKGSCFEACLSLGRAREEEAQASPSCNITRITELLKAGVVYADRCAAYSLSTRGVRENTASGCNNFRTAGTSANAADLHVLYLTSSYQLSGNG